MSFQRLLNETMAIVRKKRVKNPVGGWTETDMQIAADIPCRLSSVSSARVGNQQKIEQQREHYEADHVIFCLPDVDIQEGDQVAIRDQLFEVTGWFEPSLKRHHLEIPVLRKRRDEV